MSERSIPRTGETAKFQWPDSVFIQGGKSGIVFNKDGSIYNTAFVEAAPEGTFLRGEGATVAEAEAACWAKYLRYVNCTNEPGEMLRGAPWHGPYEARQYRNGSGYCVKCGTWMSKVLPELPEDPNREPSIIEQLLKAMLDEDEVKD